MEKKEISYTTASSERDFFNNKSSYLTFSIENEIYGISIKNITEIIGMQPITTVPAMPSFIKGIINLRGMIVPVMDLRVRFSRPEIEYNDRTCVIIIELNNIFLGLIVDSVLEVRNISEDKISEPPKINSSNSEFIEGIGLLEETVAILLSCEKLLSQEELSQLA